MIFTLDTAGLDTRQAATQARLMAAALLAMADKADAMTDARPDPSAYPRATPAPADARTPHSGAGEPQPRGVFHEAATSTKDAAFLETQSVTDMTTIASTARVLRPDDNPATGGALDVPQAPTLGAFLSTHPIGDANGPRGVLAYDEHGASQPGSSTDAAAVFGGSPFVGAGGTAAPSAPPASSPPPSPSVELDATGLPWDGRIHAQNKARNQDGSWRSKRGLNDDAERKRIEAELRAALALPPVALKVLAALPPPPPTPGAAPGTASPFADLLLYITQGKAAGWLADAHVTAALQGAGLAAMPLVATRPDLIPSIRAALEACRPSAS